MKLKKNPKANLEHFSRVFTLIGLVLTLFITYTFIEHKTYAMTKPNKLVATPKTIEETPKTIVYRIEKTKVVQQPILEEPIEEIAKPKKPTKVVDPTIVKVVVDETILSEAKISSTDPSTSETPTDFDGIDYVDIDEKTIVETIHYASVENTPVFPGCEKYKYDKIKSKKCFGSKISKFFNKKFDTDIANDLNLTGIQKINCQFIIDADGNISPDIKTSSKTHPALSQEVKNVLKQLPKMTPAKQNGKAVNLIYSLPFKFRVE